MDPTTQREFDHELAQEAPLVPFLEPTTETDSMTDIRAELSELREQLDRIEGAMERRNQ